MEGSGRALIQGTSGNKSSASYIFLENVFAILVKLTWMIHTQFVIMRQNFNKFFAFFNALLPTLSKTLYTNVAKSPAITSEHTMKTLFQCVLSGKWRQRSAYFTGPNRW